MTLPGNQIPEENLPPGGSSVPAEAAEFPTMHDRYGEEWVWVGGEGGWLCNNPQHYDGPPAAQLGAIPEQYQPMYTYDPRTNPAVWAALHEDDRQDQAASLIDYVRRLAE